MKRQNFQCTKICVGYELGEEYCQINIISPDTKGEIVSVKSNVTEESIRIPFVMAKRYGAEQWYYGKEALNKVQTGEAILTDGLYGHIREQAAVVIEGKEYDIQALVAMYIKKTMSLILDYVSFEQIDGCGFVVPELEKNVVYMWQKILSSLMIPKEKCFLISYEEAFAYYAAFQEGVQVERGILLLDYSKNMLTAKLLQTKGNTQPRLLSVTKLYHEEIEADDEKFLQCLRMILAGFRPLVVYLTGEGFETRWYETSLKFLCQGRRVFKGQNLYGTGGLWYVVERLQEACSGYIFLGEDHIKMNFLIQARKLGKGNCKEEEVELLSADLHWYEARKTVEVIPQNCETVEVVAKSLDGKKQQVFCVKLKDFPVRERKATRLELTVYFRERGIGVIQIRDLGFGQIYPATGKIWQEGFDLKHVEEKLNEGVL